MPVIRTRSWTMNIASKKIVDIFWKHFLYTYMSWSKVGAILTLDQNNLVKSEYCCQFLPALTFDRDIYILMYNLCCYKVKRTYFASPKGVLRSDIHCM